MVESFEMASCIVDKYSINLILTVSNWSFNFLMDEDTEYLGENM